MTARSFTGEQLEEIDRLCSTVIDLDPREQESLLSQAEIDPAVRNEVKRIIAGIDAQAPLLDQRPTIEVLRGPAPAAERGVNPEFHRRVIPSGQVGPYRLWRTIGEGGFGLVVEAEQDGPLQRRVAIKFLKPGLDDRRVLRRFELERRALARMDHPGIARVLDAGLTGIDSGRVGLPFVVMDLIDGHPITETCRSEHVDVRERVRLVADACVAIRHAHQRGIVHRDLKPSNILVTRRDGRREPVIIDFGIAAAILDETRPHQASRVTLAGEAIGTPEYMPPEQRSGAAGAIDVRTDIYALGAVLRTLLQTQDGDGGTPQQGPQGELAWIIERCLQVNPDDRYDSVADLEDDLRRHLDGRVVQARPPSLSYRARRFVGRHAVASALGTAAAVLILCLAVATVIALVRSVQANELKDDALALAAEREWSLERERRRLRDTSDFLRDLLASPGAWRINPEGVRSADVRVRDVLTHGSSSFERLFGGDPDTLASMRLILASTWLQLEEPEAATAELVHIDTLVANERVSPVVRAEIELLRGALRSAASDIDGALVAYTRGFELAREDGNTFSQIRNGNGRTQCLRALGQHDDAMALAEELEQLATSGLGSDHVETAVARANLAMMYAAVGRFDQAITTGREAIATYEAAGGANHIAALIARSNLAYYLRTQSRWEEADQAVLELAEDRDRLLGPDHPHTISTELAAQDALACRGELDEALRRNRALRARLARPEDDRRKQLRLQALLRASQFERAAGLPDLAVEAADQAVVAAQELGGPTRPRTYFAMLARIAALLDAGRLDDADRAVAGLTDLPQQGRGGTEVQARYALCQARRLALHGRRGEAIEQCRRACEHFEAHARPGDPWREEAAAFLDDLTAR